jgi:catechol 2,3-dioxygenase-like lactoylglutathione lyase family enzyme
VIPVDRLHHVSVVVRDLEATARSYAAILGIERWDVARYTTDRLRDTSAFGFETPFPYATATGASPGGITFRLVQPTGGLSTYAEFLVTRGEGIHSLCLATAGEAELAERLRAEDVAVAQTVTVDGAATHHHLDTRQALGGWYVEVMVAGVGGGHRVDERWDLHDEVRRPEGLDIIREAPRVWHFGVAVRDLMGRLPAYGRLLGLTSWELVHFHPDPGSLERSTLDGQPVRQAFWLAKADLPDCGFELIQPTLEPTHYRRELLDPIGEGIHHLLVVPSMPEARWSRLRDAMASLDVPVATSGSVRSGAAEFFYLDTRRRLGGYLLEVIRRSSPPDAPRGEPDFRFDLSRKAAAL